MRVLRGAHEKWKRLRPRTRWALVLGVGALFLWSRRSRAGVLSLGGSRMVVPLGQCTAPWGSKTVGNSTKTYCAIGCVATAMTIAVNALRGMRLKPDDLRPGGSAGLTASDYTGGAMLTGQVAQKLGCKIVGRIEPNPDNRTPVGIMKQRTAIDSALANGGLALVRVDYDLSTPESNHTIVCFEKAADGYKCADPANGNVITLSLDALFHRRSATKTYASVGVAPIFRA